MKFLLGVGAVGLLAGLGTNSMTGRATGGGGCGGPEAAQNQAQSAATASKATAPTSKIMTAMKKADLAQFGLENHLLATATTYVKLEEECNRKFSSTCTKRLEETHAEYKDIASRITKSFSAQKSRIVDLAKQVGKDNAQLTELAITTWITLLRRRTGPNFHAVSEWQISRPTAHDIVSRIDLKNCVDLHREQWLYNLAEAITTNDHPRYLALHARFHRAMTCAPTNASRRFADDLVDTFEAAVSFVGRRTGQTDAVRRAMLNFGWNLFVSLWDQLKPFGPSKLYDFMLENRAGLKQLVMDPESIPAQTGIALYERRGDRMLVIPSDLWCETLDLDERGVVIRPNPECISVSGGIDALLDPERLGMGLCPLAELFAGGFDVQTGYTCDENACAESQVQAEEPGMKLSAETGRTPYDLPLSTLATTMDCNGGGGGSQRGNLQSLLDKLSCVTAVITNHRDTAKCVAQYSPSARRAHLDAVFEQPAQPRNADECGDPLAQGNADDCSGNERACTGFDRVKSRAEVLLGQKKEQFAQALSDYLGTTVTAEQVQDIGQDVLNDAKAYDGKEFTDATGGRNEPGAGYYDTTNDKAIFNAANFEDEGQVDSPISPCSGNHAHCEHYNDKAMGMLHEVLHGVIDKIRESCDTCPAYGTAEEDAISAATGTCSPDGHQHKCSDSGSGDSSGSKYCAPDVGDCGDCNPGSAAAEAFYACSENEQENGARPEPPGNIDPPPWQDSDAPEWARCFQDQQARDRITNRNTLACASLDCGPDRRPVLVDGRCICNSRGSSRRRNGCGFIDCGPDSSPVSGPDGRCRCNPQGSAVLGPPRGGWVDGLLDGPCGDGPIEDFDPQQVPEEDRENCRLATLDR